jgi:penicillin-binding protein 1C
MKVLMLSKAFQHQIQKIVLKQVVFGITLMTGLSFSVEATVLPNFQTVKQNFDSSELVLLSDRGEWLDSIRTQFHKRQFPWLRLQTVSPIFIKSLMEAEDQGFYEHQGVEWRRILQASVNQLLSKLIHTKKFGASTLTMQLADLLKKQELQLTARHKDCFDKWNQILLAQEIEKTWTKAEILEAYLNLVPFQGECVGLWCASNYLFKHSPDALTESESKLLAHLIRSPNQDLTKLQSTLTQIPETQSKYQKSPHLAYHYLRQQSRPSRQSLVTATANSMVQPTTQTIHSTLNKNFQIKVTEILEQQLAQLKNQNVRHAAAVIWDYRSQAYKAYVGGLQNAQSQDSFEVDGVQALRQAGSTLKPFLYGQALELGLVQKESQIDDSPARFDVDGFIYEPDNYNHRYFGMVPVRLALASSLNIPAIRVTEKVGVEEIVKTLKKFEFKIPQEAEHYGPSIALGSLDVTLEHLVQAYAKLAQHKVFSKKTILTLEDILSRSENRALSFGLDSPLTTSIQTVVKTGTSKDMRDNWCIGYNDRYVVGVWVGNHQGDPMWNVSGVSGAAIAWHDIMEYISKPTISRQLSGQLSQKSQLDFKSKSTSEAEPQNQILEVQTAEIILSPHAQQVIAIDPEIPADNQALPLRASSQIPFPRIWNIYIQDQLIYREVQKDSKQQIYFPLMTIQDFKKQGLLKNQKSYEVRLTLQKTQSTETPLKGSELTFKVVTF